MKNSINVDAVIQMMKEVGDYQLKHFRKNDYKINSKTTSIDVVTEIDLNSEAMIIQWIKNHYPGHSIVSEEMGEMIEESDFEWIIDPLDGTTNYSKGIPIFAISIAVHYKSKRTLGFVYVPYLNDFYYAIEGQGAFFNDERMPAIIEVEMNQAVIASGFPYDRMINPDNNVKYAARVIPLVKGFRRLGAAAYDLCLVAQGVYDAYWEMGLKAWDIEAGLLIIEEVSGTHCMIKTANGRDMLVAGNNRTMHQLKNVLEMNE